MKILVVDNYDSFTYNLVHILRKFEGVTVDVKRNDEISVEEPGLYDKIVFSPGPGLPGCAHGARSGRMVPHPPRRDLDDKPLER